MIKMAMCIMTKQVLYQALSVLLTPPPGLQCDEEGSVFEEEFLSERDPSILHFLLASGDQISSKQLRDDLMTMLVAGHETTAAVLTWTTYMLAKNPEYIARIREEVRARVLGVGWKGRRGRV